MSTPRMSIPKMSIPIMSTVPKCLFPLCLLCQNAYSHNIYFISEKNIDNEIDVILVLFDFRQKTRDVKNQSTIQLTSSSLLSTGSTQENVST